MTCRKHVPFLQEALRDVEEACAVCAGSVSVFVHDVQEALHDVQDTNSSQFVAPDSLFLFAFKLQ